MRYDDSAIASHLTRLNPYYYYSHKYQYLYNGCYHVESMQTTYTHTAAKMSRIQELQIPDWKTYRARAWRRPAGQVGGAVSPSSHFSRNVSSNPKPLGPSGPVHLQMAKVDNR